MRRAHKQASEDNLRSKGSNYCTFLSERTSPLRNHHHYPSPHPQLYLFPFVDLLRPLVVSVSAWLWAQTAGKTEFHSDSAAATATVVLLLSASLLGGFHHFQTAVAADRAKRQTATDQSQANSVFGYGQPVKQWRLPASLSRSFSFYHSLSLFLAAG